MSSSPESVESVNKDVTIIEVKYSPQLELELPSLIVRSCQQMQIPILITAFNVAIRVMDKNSQFMAAEIIKYFNHHHGDGWNCSVDNNSTAGDSSLPWIEEDYVVFSLQDTIISLYRTKAQSQGGSLSNTSESVDSSDEKEIDSITVSYPRRILTIHYCNFLPLSMIPEAFNLFLQTDDVSSDPSTTAEYISVLFSRKNEKEPWKCIIGMKKFIDDDPPDWNGRELLVFSVGKSSNRIVCLYRSNGSGEVENGEDESDESEAADESDESEAADESDESEAAFNDEDNEEIGGETGGADDEFDKSKSEKYDGDYEGSGAEAEGGDDKSKSSKSEDNDEEDSGEEDEDD